MHALTTLAYVLLDDVLTSPYAVGVGWKCQIFETFPHICSLVWTSYALVDCAGAC